MKWLRLYHDTPNDPKWRVVSVRSGQPVGNVLAVWMQMLVCASEAEERGTLEGWDDETVAAMLGYAPSVVTVIHACMQGLVLDGIRLSGWEKRQRQDSDDAAERKRRSRANKQSKTPPNGSGGGHAPNGLDCDADCDVTVSSRDKEEMSRDNEQKSRDRHVTASARDRLTESKKDTEAYASGAAAPSGGTVVSFPMDDKSRLFGPVLALLIAALPGRKPDDVRAKVAKAYHALGVEEALDLTARAAVKDEPWSWFCKTIDARTKPKPPAGGRADPNAASANAYFLERYAQAEKQADQWSAS